MSDFGVVLLTMGQRPEELDRALRSLLGQRDVDVDIVVVECVRPPRRRTLCRRRDLVIIQEARRQH